MAAITAKRKAQISRNCRFTESSRAFTSRFAESNRAFISRFTESNRAFISRFTVSSRSATVSIFAQSCATVVTAGHGFDFPNRSIGQPPGRGCR